MAEPAQTFAARAGLDTEARRAHVRDVLATCDAENIHAVRLSFVDQHGLLKGKTFAATELALLFGSGCGITGSLLAKDTGNQYAFPLWGPSASATMSALAGARDMVMMPDPATFRRLPWAAGTGWLLCDLFDVRAAAVPVSARAVLTDALARLGRSGYRLRAGLEFEFHLFRPDPAGSPTPVHPGWDLLSETLADRVEPLLEPIRFGLEELGLPPRSMEVELGPGQIELTFPPSEGLAVADQAVLVRSAVKQLAQRQGLHATFMCRPGLPDSFPSGWHLHQSLVDGAGANAFVANAASTAHGGLVSAVGSRWAGGLLAHAAPSCLLTSPTVTAYKRYRPNSVAPDRIAWGAGNRGAMLRLVGGWGDPATHIENRVGDPAANPYLYLAAQVLSGLDGLQHQLDAPPPTDQPYRDSAGERLPRNLGEAVAAFESDSFYRDALGPEVVGYFAGLAHSTWSRFNAAVTDWEQREYFELF